jgi:hypothetical protein
MYSRGRPKSEELGGDWIRHDVRRLKNQSFASHSNVLSREKNKKRLAFPMDGLSEISLAIDKNKDR